MTTAAIEVLSPAQIALAYHARTKHSLERYAAGPETLDWDSQPNPFREYAGCKRTQLPLPLEDTATSMAQIYKPADVAPAQPALTSLSTLLLLSMALSAWKEFGPDRWALRCNPSSGNLHPTETYVVASNIPGVDDGLHHYVSRDHTLELRCSFATDANGPPRLWIGFSSIHWREAWKYGERAFRYGQLDVGHAIGAIRYAAGVLGWSARLVDDFSGKKLAALLGLNRAKDFTGAEREEPELLMAIDIDPGASAIVDDALPRPLGDESWSGRANLLDPHPMYRWPVINEVSQATHERVTAPASYTAEHYPPLQQMSEAPAAGIIRGRRSAQRFDAKFEMSADVFYRLLDPLLARRVAPWDVWNFTPRIHPVFFVHRVAGLEPGLYALPRHTTAEQSLRKAMRADFAWQRLPGAPPHLPLLKLAAADCRAVSKTLSCHQAIASDGCFSLGMITEFEPLVANDAWRYRQLYWEAGLLGQVLYLEAEAAGLRGTGIGCFFDDSVHAVLGIESTQFQSLYHFTVGRPLTDDRIMTLPAYPDARA
jgi:SagB-type dehydrogenase family enzyme